MRPLALVLVLLVAGCSSSRFSASTTTTASATTTTVATSAVGESTTAVPAGPLRLPVRIVLSSYAIKAGSAVVAKVIVDNVSGRAFDAYACKQLFQIVLTGPAASQVANPPLTCIQSFPIPVGISTFRVTFNTRYSRCAKKPPAIGLQLCLPNGKAPALPFGGYKLNLVDSAGFVRPPSAVYVLLIPVVVLPKCTPATTTRPVKLAKPSPATTASTATPLRPPKCAL